MDQDVEGEIDLNVAQVEDRTTGDAVHLERGSQRLRAPQDVRDLASRRSLAQSSPARVSLRMIVVATVYLLAFGTGLVVDRWWAWALVWSVQAFVLLICGAVMHEGVHANLTGRRGVDRVLSSTAGWLIFLPAAAYRPYHLQHHATTISAADPSGANAKPFTSRRQYLLIMVLAGPGFTAQMWSIALRTVIGRTPDYVADRFRRQILVETAIAVALYVGVAIAAPALGIGHLVLFGWVIPAVIGLCVVAPFILMPEHYNGAEDATILESTATVGSNALVSYVYLNNNHHTAHHLLSSCNPLQLQEITDLLGDRVQLHYRSYTAFHRDVFRSLRW